MNIFIVVAIHKMRHFYILSPMVSHLTIRVNGRFYVYTFMIKVRSRSGQMRSNFELDIFASKGCSFDAACRGDFNGGLRFSLSGLEQPKINFENLTSSLQNSFFIITTPKNKLSS